MSSASETSAGRTRSGPPPADLTAGPCNAISSSPGRSQPPPHRAPSPPGSTCSTRKPRRVGTAQSCSGWPSQSGATATQPSSPAGRPTAVARASAALSAGSSNPSPSLSSPAGTCITHRGRRQPGRPPGRARVSASGASGVRGGCAAMSASASARARPTHVRAQQSVARRHS
jgi:hypothetical protein